MLWEVGDYDANDDQAARVTSVSGYTVKLDGHEGSYIESVVWNQPGDASSPQYGVDGSMLCSWYIVQYSRLVSRQRECVWWFGTNG